MNRLRQLIAGTHGQWILIGLLVAVAAGAITVWESLDPEPAYAQSGGKGILPDSGSQRAEMIKQQTATNTKLDQLLELFKSGKVTVKAEITNLPDDTKKKKGS